MKGEKKPIPAAELGVPVAAKAWIGKRYGK
jgi:hypothetical protein